MTRDTHATSPHAYVDHRDEASRYASPRGSTDSTAHRLTLAEAGVSAEAQAELIHKVKCLRDTFSSNDSTLKEM